MSTLFTMKYITLIYDLFVKAMSTILNRRSEGHKDETQLKATAQVFVCMSMGWAWGGCILYNYATVDMISYFCRLMCYRQYSTGLTVIFFEQSVFNNFN